MRTLLLLIIGSIWGCSYNTSSQNKGKKETRRLYLIRHAKSSHKNDSLEDIDRPLNDRGKSDAILIGKELFKRGVTFDKVVISPSKRTKSTAKRIMKGVNFEKDSIERDSSIYRCRTQVLISKIRNLHPRYKSVAVIGHNPATIQAANHFQKDTIFTGVPTCGVIAIEFESNSWENLGNKEGRYVFFDYPKKYKKEK